MPPALSVETESEGWGLAGYGARWAARVPMDVDSGGRVEGIGWSVRSIQVHMERLMRCLWLQSVPESIRGHAKKCLSALLPGAGPSRVSFLAMGRGSAGPTEVRILFPASARGRQVALGPLLPACLLALRCGRHDWEAAPRHGTCQDRSWSSGAWGVRMRSRSRGRSRGRSSSRGWTTSTPRLRCCLGF